MCWGCLVRVGTSALGEVVSHTSQTGHEAWPRHGTHTGRNKDVEEMAQWGGGGLEMGKMHAHVRVEGSWAFSTFQALFFRCVVFPVLLWLQFTWGFSGFRL